VSASAAHDALVWITGASSGIGRALADTVPWEDARVIDVSRSGSPDLEHVEADLSGPSGWDAVRESLGRELAAFRGDRVVFVHSAATLTPIGFAGEVDADAYAAQVILNSAAPQVLGDLFIRAVHGLDVRADYVVLTSGAATAVYEGWSAYGAGKAAVDHWVRIAGAERERRGGRVRVLAIAPGVVATPMQEEIRRAGEERFPNVDRFVELHEAGALKDPHDVARDIWRLLERPLENGAVLDLRELDA
jgi:benzil reductase ((S)-benzoin forming)